jgi:sulfotransferase
MNLIALSGLPRTGSTLLSAILSQNPEIHAEGNSAVCQLMWDAQVSCETAASEQLLANRRYGTQDDIVRAIPAIYYKSVTARHIVDKCRSWTLPDNVAMLRRYVTDDPKVIVMTRPLDEIVDSFQRLRAANGLEPAEGLLTPGSEPIMRSLEGVEYARSVNRGEFLFVDYDDLVTDTLNVLDSIYEFCGFDPFGHDLTNIVNRHAEDDLVYGLTGMHNVRPTIGRSHAIHES